MFAIFMTKTEIGDNNTEIFMDKAELAIICRKFL
jgi:hypothetical protein